MKEAKKQDYATTDNVYLWPDSSLFPFMRFKGSCQRENLVIVEMERYFGIFHSTFWAIFWSLSAPFYSLTYNSWLLLSSQAYCSKSILGGGQGNLGRAEKITKRAESNVAPPRPGETSTRESESVKEKVKGLFFRVSGRSKLSVSFCISTTAEEPIEFEMHLD